MRTQICSQTKSDGTPCRAVALDGYARCFAHQRQYRRQKVGRGATIRLRSLTDPCSIQRAINRIFRTTASGSLPLVRAAALLERIRLAMDGRGAPESVAPCQLLPSNEAGSAELDRIRARIYNQLNQSNPAQDLIPRSRGPERKI